MVKALKKNEQGFTLIEILVVLVILAILAAVSIPSLTGFISEAQKKTYIMEARTVYTAVQSYASEKHDKPDRELESELKGIIEKGHVLNEILTGSISHRKEPEITEIQIENHVVQILTYQVDGYYVKFSPNSSNNQLEEIECGKVDKSE